MLLQHIKRLKKVGEKSVQLNPWVKEDEETTRHFYLFVWNNSTNYLQLD